MICGKGITVLTTGTQTIARHQWTPNACDQRQPRAHGLIHI